MLEIQQQNPEDAKKRLLAYADAIRRMQEIRANGSCPVVISTEEDELLSHERGYGRGSRPEDYLDAFAEYIKTNMNEIAALNIVCTRPKELTRESLKSLRLALDREGFTTQQLTFRCGRKRDGVADPGSAGGAVRTGQINHFTAYQKCV